MTGNTDPDKLDCYSDHEHDIHTVGACIFCASTSVDDVGHVLPQVKRLKGIDPVKASAIVMQTGSAKMVDGVLLDHFTASAIQAVHTALSTAEARAKLREMSLAKAAAVCWKLLENAKT